MTGIGSFRGVLQPAVWKCSPAKGPIGNGRALIDEWLSASSKEGMMASSLVETDRDGAASWMHPFDESERRTTHLEVLSQLSGCFAASTLDEAASCLIRVLRLTFAFDLLEGTLFKERAEGVVWRVRETGPGSPTDILTEEAVRWVHRRQRVLWSGRRAREPWSLTSDDPVSPRGPDGRSFCALPLSTP